MAAISDLVAKSMSATRRYRRLLAAVALAMAVVVLAAMAFPVGTPAADATGATGLDLQRPPAGAAPQEDLSAFLAGRRWGVALQDIIEEAAAAEAAKQIEMTPELAQIGFVGLMVAPDEHAVLLVMPDGKISRLTEGDTLPDGRTLVAVTDNSLTLALSLEEGEKQQDVLPLFPRIRTE